MKNGLHRARSLVKQIDTNQIISPINVKLQYDKCYKGKIYGHTNAFTGKMCLDCESVFPNNSHSGLKVGRVTRQGGRGVRVAKISRRTNNMWKTPVLIVGFLWVELCLPKKDILKS